MKHCSVWSSALCFVLLLAVGETKAFLNHQHNSIVQSRVKKPDTTVLKMPNQSIAAKTILSSSGDKIEQAGVGNQKGNTNTFVASVFGAVSSITPALASTACCWGPAVLSMFGAGAASPMLSEISRYRHYLLGMSGTMISYGFYRAYGPPSRQEHACCMSEAAKKEHARKLKINRAVVWGSLAIALYGASYGRVSMHNFLPRNGAFNNLWQGGAAGGAAGGVMLPSMLKLQVSGMSCGGCVNKVQRAIEGISGVNNVVVNLQTGQAVIQGVGLDSVKEKIIKAAITKAGYPVG